MSDPQPETAKMQKVLRLVAYLTRLASLRTKIIRNIDEYQNVLWVKDVPRQKGCYTQAWGRYEDYDLDVWMEVQTRREPQLPSVPLLCKDWIENSSLRNKNGRPSQPANFPYERDLAPEVGRPQNYAVA